MRLHEPVAKLPPRRASSWPQQAQDNTFLAGRNV